MHTKMRKSTQRQRHLPNKSLRRLDQFGEYDQRRFRAEENRARMNLHNVPIIDLNGTVQEPALPSR